MQVLLAQQIAAVHTADLAPDVPKWFADVSVIGSQKNLSRDDETKSWDTDATNAAESMNRPDDFITNRMPSDKAALVSYLFVKSWCQRAPDSGV